MADNKDNTRRHLLLVNHFRLTNTNANSNTSIINNNNNNNKLLHPLPHPLPQRQTQHHSNFQIETNKKQQQQQPPQHKHKHKQQQQQQHDEQQQIFVNTPPPPLPPPHPRHSRPPPLNSSNQKLKLILKLPHTPTPSPPPLLRLHHDIPPTSPPKSTPKPSPAVSLPPPRLLSPPPLPPSPAAASLPPSPLASAAAAARGLPPVAVSPPAVAISAPVRVPSAVGVPSPAGVPSVVRGLPAAPYVAVSPPVVAPSESIAGLDVECPDEDSEERPLKKRKLKIVSDRLGSTQIPTAGSGAHTPLPRHQKVASEASYVSSGKPNPKDRGTEDLKGGRVSPRAQLENQHAHLLPSNFVLEGILDHLQRKDTFGVFSEPVDPKQVPDYYDVIKDPMDFGTMRKKIAQGMYLSIEHFKADVLLICSNAMHYNARDTIYHKQARSIRDAARREFQALKYQIAERGQNVMMKQRVGGLSAKKSSKKLSAAKYRFELGGSDYFSGATLATCGEPEHRLGHVVAAKGRKSSWPDRLGGLHRTAETQASAISGLPGSINSFVGSLYDSRVDQQDELSGSLLKSMALKENRRASLFDENRRNSYKPHNISIHTKSPFPVSVVGDLQQLVPLGDHQGNAYARSLSRFAADMGPLVWKIAAEKIQKALPPGCPFGPGWVGDQEAPDNALLYTSNKSQRQSIDQVESKRITTAESRQLLSEQVTQAAGKGSLVSTSSGIQSGMTGNQKASSFVVLASPMSRAVSDCQPAPSAVRSVPPYQNVRVLPEGVTQSLQPSRKIPGEPIKSSLMEGHFVSEVSQSKLLEMVSQTWCKQTGLAPDCTSQSHPTVDLCSGEKVVNATVGRDGGENSNAMVSAGVAVTHLSMKKPNVMVGHAPWPPQPASAQTSSMEKVIVPNTGHGRHDVSHLNLISMPGVTNSAFSSTSCVSAGTLTGGEDVRMSPWVRSEPIDLSHASGNSKMKLQNQLPTNILYNQFAGTFHHNPQHQDSQVRVEHQQQVQPQVKSIQNQISGASHHNIEIKDTQAGVRHQQHDHQARPAFQQEANEWLAPTIPGHQFSSDVPSFVQQQLAKLHSQGSSKPAPPLIHLGVPRNGELQDQSVLSLHTKFSSPMVAGIVQSHNQSWHYGNSQYTLQQPSNTLHSLPADLNVSLTPLKSHVNQPSSRLTDSQQPDLALQL